MLTHNQSSQLKRFMKCLFLNVPISLCAHRVEGRGTEGEKPRETGCLGWGAAGGEL